MRDLDQAKQRRDVWLQAVCEENGVDPRHYTYHPAQGVLTRTQAPQQDAEDA